MLLYGISIGVATVLMASGLELSKNVKEFIERYLSLIFYILYL